MSTAPLRRQICAALDPAREQAKMASLSYAKEDNH